MRITIDLDEDILRVAEYLAQEREQSLDRVLSDLVRQGLQPARPIIVEHGVIPTLPPIPGARPVTTQVVKDLLEAAI